MGKSIIFIFILWSVLRIVSVEATTRPTITFRDLAEEQKAAPVEIRGFLYKESAGQWVLLDKPNIKSCCIHKESIKVIIDGDIDDSGVSTTAVLLQGDLFPKSKGVYLLANAALMKPEFSSHGALVAAVVVVGALGAFFLLRPRKN